MRRILVLLLCVLLSSMIVLYVEPFFSKENNIQEINAVNEKSVIKQNVLTIDSNTEHVYNKIYYNNTLIGVINDLDKVHNMILDEYRYYEKDFPNSELGFGEDIFIVKEKSFLSFEDKDDEIVQYLMNNQLLGIKATAVEFSTAEGIYEIIYVRNIEEFRQCYNDFLLNFISEDALRALRASEKIDEPTEFGTVESGIKIDENISYKDVIINPDNIFTNYNDIYNFLCYGRNTERNFYTTKEGDTLNAVGYHFGDMSPKQLVMLNPDVLSSTDQIIVPGTKLNVTYYTSPITVRVTKKRLAQEDVYPENPIYKVDEELEAGTMLIDTKEETGLRNVLYEETWLNGVLYEGKEVSSKIVKNPVQGVILRGSKIVSLTGSGNFIWPIDQPVITCGWGCYPGHEGTDIASRYNRYGNIYAADSGTVVRVSYDSISGYYIIIDHGNGFQTYYGHMSTRGFVEEGQSVSRGEIIGIIGMTGLATGPHVHFMIYVEKVKVNVCNYMNCAAIS